MEYKIISLLEFLDSLPSKYTAELYFFWEPEDIQFEEDGSPTEGLDEEVCQCDTIESLLKGDFNGYGSYWNDIRDVYGVNKAIYNGYFSKVTIDHIRENVEMIYIRNNYSN